MTASVRFATLDNTTNPQVVLTPKLAYPLITIEKEGARLVYKRIFKAIDIGVEAGKTRDNTTGADQAKNPLGCLLMTVTGAKIKEVVAWSIRRDATVQNRVGVQSEVRGTTTGVTLQKFYFSPDRLSVYVWDASIANSDNEIKAGDYMLFDLLLSNN